MLIVPIYILTMFLASYRLYRIVNQEIRLEEMWDIHHATIASISVGPSVLAIAFANAASNAAPSETRTLSMP